MTKVSLSVGRADELCGSNQVTHAIGFDSDELIVTFALNKRRDSPRATVGPFPTILVLRPPPPHLCYTRWLSLSLSFPPHLSQISAPPAPRSPHGRLSRPNITPQERLKPRRFERVREDTSFTRFQLIRSLDIDADLVYVATVTQRSHILQQLEEAEKDARDALFTLEMMEMELACETAAIKSTLSHLSETIPPHEFEEMFEFAFGQSKQGWENVWKHEWIVDGAERDKFIERPRDPSKSPRSNPQPAPHVPSSPLPPSSPPPPTSPANSRDCLPPLNTDVFTNGVPFDQLNPTPLDGFKAPRGFVDTFGSTMYRTTVEPVAGPSKPQPQQSRRLKRDDRRMEVLPDGTLVLVDVQEEIEAHRRAMNQELRLQAQRRIPPEVVDSLRNIVEPGAADRIQDPPVTWSRLFDNKDGDPLPHDPNDLANPFAQDDHVPPTHPEPNPGSGEPDEDDEEEESESGGNQQCMQQ